MPSEPEWLTRARLEGRILSEKGVAVAEPRKRAKAHGDPLPPVEEAEPADDLIFDLPIPPSTNNLYVNTRNGRVLSEKGREWKDAAALIVRMCKLRPWVASVRKPFGIEYTVVGPVNMSRDLANCEKIMTDVLVECGVIPGDSLRAGLWRVCLMYAHSTDGEPHVRVRIHGANGGS